MEPILLRLRRSQQLLFGFGWNLHTRCVPSPEPINRPVLKNLTAIFFLIDLLSDQKHYSTVMALAQPEVTRFRIFFHCIPYKRIGYRIAVQKTSHRKLSRSLFFRQNDRFSKNHFFRNNFLKTVQIETAAIQYQSNDSCRHFKPFCMQIESQLPVG